MHLTETNSTKADVTTRAGVLARTYTAGVVSNERSSKALASILISVDTGNYLATDYGSADELIEAGYRAAEANRNALLAYALSKNDWSQYLEARVNRVGLRPGVLETVKVVGGSSGAQARVHADMEALKGHSIDTSMITKALLPVQASGNYQASFETYDPPLVAPMTTQTSGPDNGVLVRLSRASNGPPFILLGSDVTAASGNVTHSTFDLRLVQQDLGGFGSELRGDFRIGFLTQGSVEYYHQLTKSGYFIQPNIGIVRQPVYLWQNQVRVSEQLSQNAGGGIEVGRTFTRSLRASLQYQAQVTRWEPAKASSLIRTNLGGTPSYSGTAQTATFRLVFDQTTSETVTAVGLRFELTGGALFHFPASETAPLFHASVSKSFSFRDGGVIGLFGGGDSYADKHVADPLRFTMGGPLRLSASSIDEYRGTDDYLVRASYSRRIATLPSGLGKGLYLSLGYEGAEIWAPESTTILRQDGFLMGVAETPIGVLKFGGALGDAGRRKVFFTFGRLF